MARIAKKVTRYSGAIEGDLMEMLKAQAKKEERTVNYMINRLIRKYCEELQNKE